MLKNFVHQLYSFSWTNFPNKKHNGDIINDFSVLPNKSWPRLHDFDDVLSEFVGWDDVVKWDPDCTIGMRLHNFYVFKDAINQITDYVYGHDYILEQVVEKDIYKAVVKKKDYTLTHFKRDFVNLQQ